MMMIMMMTGRKMMITDFKYDDDFSVCLVVLLPQPQAAFLSLDSQ